MSLVENFERLLNEYGVDYTRDDTKKGLVFKYRGEELQLTTKLWMSMFPYPEYIKDYYIKKLSKAFIDSVLSDKEVFCSCSSMAVIDNLFTEQTVENKFENYNDSGESYSYLAA